MLRTNKGSLIIAGLILFFAVHTQVYALSVSEIQLNSHLNQVLDANIMLLSATPEEIENLSLGLKQVENSTSPVFHWPDVSVDIVRKEDGKYYLHISSKEPITEPVISFVLELNWSKGQLKRKYILLIDPQLG